MYGIFHEARKSDFPINQYIQIINSSRYFNTLWKPVDILINESNDAHGWASEGLVNSYVYFTFLVFQLTIEGYSLSYPSQDDEILRNWELRCYYQDKNFQIDFHSNDQTLCPNTNPNDYCGYNDQKYFPLSKTYTCNALRLTQTGPNNSGRYYLNLLGFEVFGKMALPRCETLAIKIGCMNFDLSLLSVFILM